MGKLTPTVMEPDREYLLRYPYGQLETAAAQAAYTQAAENYRASALGASSSAHTRYLEKVQDDREAYASASRKYYRNRHYPESRLPPRYSSHRRVASPVNESNRLMHKYFKSPNKAFGARDGLRPDGRLIGDVVNQHANIVEMHRHRTCMNYP